MAYNSELFNTLLNSINPQAIAPTAPRSLITVNGIAEARGFNIGAGESVALIDSEKDIFYIKQCDTLGKNTLKAYSYTEIEIDDATASGVSKKDFDSLSAQVKEIGATVKELKENGKLNFKHYENNASK